MILLIGHTQAGEMDLVVQKLRKMNLSQEIVRLNLNDIAYATPITVHLCNSSVHIDLHIRFAAEFLYKQQDLHGWRMHLHYGRT